jgi:ATP-dependent DNA ligase
VALRGHDLRRYPLTTRKAMLKDVLKDSEPVRPAYCRERRAPVPGGSRARHRGIIAKRADSPYGRQRAKWNE